MSKRFRLKICGVTNLEDAVAAAAAGADYVGVLVGVARSPRSLTLDRAANILSRAPLPSVVLVDTPDEPWLRELLGRLKPQALQFLGVVSEQLICSLKTCHPQLELWKSLHLPPAGHPASIQDMVEEALDYLRWGISRFVLDTAVKAGETCRYGGTGIANNWKLAGRFVSQVPAPVFLAGGITPYNVAQALQEVGPFGIDVSSGVESEIGRKDPSKIRAMASCLTKCSQG